ncbi:MAG TPA: c-type cytochrome [Verrucomicrobiales bacterium]|nr:c-type cytochrome [Verrucomicrobiales bacterium]
MRWDAKGRLWVSCSTTYPHIYPGNEPNDKIVILEDTDWDGKADRSTVFADDVQIPLSFELGDGGVYVSEEPFLVFLKDTDGDGKADFRRKIMAGFGCEDSHHALHDFVWTPDGDLLFRESIFHHSQIETPYGPIRADNSAWFRLRPDTHRLVTFGNYPNTNPWGVTFDDWGHHVASHPVFASAFHATNPPYPEQHPRATGIPAYSGVCGHEFVDFDFWPEELHDCFIKVRYKPSNRVEIHKWIEKDDHFEEAYQGDLLYSSNLSFIPTDLRYGPRGAMYICDWYNPIKGHAQYSLRDERRDRSAGRIWRIVPKGATLQDPPKIAGAPILKLLNNLKRREYRYRYWTKRELRGRPAEDVRIELDEWVKNLDASDLRFRHHQIEAVWLYRNISRTHPDLLRELLGCEEHHARAAAVRQLRYWYGEFPDSIELLRSACNDSNGIVRMEAAIAASYIGSVEALDAMLDVANHPRDTHLNYAFTSSLGAESLRRHWQGNPKYAGIPLLLKQSKRSGELVERGRSASQAEFDSHENLKSVRITCLPERMKFDVEQFTVQTGQPVKLVLVNPDATDHNLVIVQPGTLEEVGMAANEMAKDPRNANSDFIPSDKKDKILHYTAMIGPTRSSRIQVLRFNAPPEPGIYPYVCTFPGHWVIMTGEMLVVDDLSEIDDLIASRNAEATFTDWSMDHFKDASFDFDATAAQRGAKVFKEARCNQCHVVQGDGIGLGPDLTQVKERYTGNSLLQQILNPSSEINEQYRTYQLTKKDGEVVVGNILKEDKQSIHLIPNLFNPAGVVVVPQKQIKRKTASELSSMPNGLVAALTRDQILELLAYLQSVGGKI